MDGTQIETLLLTALSRAAQASHRIFDLAEFCVPGMNTERETEDFLIGVQIAEDCFSAAADDLERILKLYGRGKVDV